MTSSSNIVTFSLVGSFIMVICGMFAYFLYRSKPMSVKKDNSQRPPYNPQQPLVSLMKKDEVANAYIGNPIKVVNLISLFLEEEKNNYLGNVRGDGNCFYRALLLSVIISLHKDIMKPKSSSDLQIDQRQKALQDLLNVYFPSSTDLLSIDWGTFVYSKGGLHDKETTHNIEWKDLKCPATFERNDKQMYLNYLTELFQTDKTIENIVELWNQNQVFDFIMIYCLRHAIFDDLSIQIDKKSSINGLSINVWIQTWSNFTPDDIKKMGQDAQEFISTDLFTSYLKCPIKLYLDGGNLISIQNYGMDDHHNNKDKTVSTILLIPGHYYFGC